MSYFIPGILPSTLRAIFATLRCSNLLPANLSLRSSSTRKTENKKAPVKKRQGLVYFKAWRCPTLTWGDPTLPSALSSFTSEFGMGSGGSYSLLPPGKPVEERSDETVPSLSRDLYLTKRARSSEFGKPRYSVLLHITPKHLLGVIWSSLTVN